MNSIQQRPLPKFGTKDEYFDEDTTPELLERQYKLLRDVYTLQKSYHTCNSVRFNRLYDCDNIELQYDTLLKKEPNLLKQKAVGLWVSLLNGCIILQYKGTILQHTSNKFILHINQCNTRRFTWEVLYLEEMLYLMERASLIVFDGTNNSLLTIEAIYKILLDRSHNMGLHDYSVYSYFRRAGVLVQRQYHHGNHEIEKKRKKRLTFNVHIPAPSWVDYAIKCSGNFDSGGVNKLGHTNKRLKIEAVSLPTASECRETFLVESCSCNRDDTASAETLLHLKESVLIWEAISSGGTDKDEDTIPIDEATVICNVGLDQPVEGTVSSLCEKTLIALVAIEGKLVGTLLASPIDELYSLKNHKADRLNFKSPIQR